MRRSNRTSMLAAVAAILLLAACAPKSFDSEFREAEANVGLGDTDAALAAYRRVADRYRQDPRRPLILFRIAEIYENFLGERSMAIEAYGRLVDEYPLAEESRIAREKRAALSEIKGQFDAAIEDYYALIKHYPNGPDLNRYRILLVGAYLAQRNFPQARIEVKPLVEGADVPPEIREQALFAAAESYFLEDKPEKAAPFYQAMLKNFPESKFAGEAKLHLATCIEEMGYLGAARELTNEAKNDYPNKKVIDARIKSLDERGKKPADGKE